MIHCQCHFFSKHLGYPTDVTVLLPHPEWKTASGMDISSLYPEDRRHPVLYLLHGSAECGEAWLWHTHIEQYAQRAGIAVVMPSGKNSFFCDAVSGEKYHSFVAEELIAFSRSVFPLSTKRDDTFIAGASMGGYGAARLALDGGGLFSALGIFSGALSPFLIQERLRAIGIDEIRFDLLFGSKERYRGSSHDLFCLAEHCPPDFHKPRVRLYCGEDDTINGDINREFADLLVLHGFDVHFDSQPGGHDWDYWDWCLEDFVTRLAPHRAEPADQPEKG